MSATNDIINIMGPLRDYFAEHLPADLLPVPKGYFSIDGLVADYPSMSLQSTGGTVVKTYINGNRKMLMPFTIFYSSPDAVNDNTAKSEMQGVLNGIGEWMREEPMPYLGGWLEVSTFEQVLLASVIAQTEQMITYQAGYALGYTTKRR